MIRLLQVRFKYYSRNIPANSTKSSLDDGSVFIKKPLPIVASNPPIIKPKGREIPSKKLTSADLEEIKRLRLEDPKTWTVGKLAQKFETSKWTILSQVTLPRDNAVKQERLEEKEREFLNASLGRQLTIVNRLRRKSLW